MSDNLDHIRQLEAILFASKKPLSLEDIQARLPDAKDILSLLNTLKTHYEERGFHLVQNGHHWSFKTAADLSDVLALEKEEQKTLSRAAMETLAIVAYHQPVTRAEIENIRGVATSKGTLDILIEAGWVKPGRRRQVPGKPLTWITTDHFLDHFGLETLSALPGVEEMKASGLLDKRPALETLPGMQDMFEIEEKQSTIEKNDNSNVEGEN